MQDIDAGLAKGFGAPNADGALVTDVGADSPAAKAGLMSGDVIVAVNDKPVTSADNLRVMISQLRPGSQAKLKIYRNGTPKTIVVTLGERPDMARLNRPNPTTAQQPQKAQSQCPWRRDGAGFDTPDSPATARDAGPCRRAGHGGGQRFKFL